MTPRSRSQNLREWTEKPTNALATVDDSAAWRNFKRDNIPPSTEDGVDYYELLQARLLQLARFLQMPPLSDVTEYSLGVTF